MKRLLMLNSILVCSLCLLLFPSAAVAQGTAEQSAPMTEGYVGSPIPMTITIKNAQEWDPPVMPQINGLQVDRQQNGKSTSIRIFNGVRTEMTAITYSFAIHAEAPGTYVIPSFPIMVDGQSLMTRPVTLNFRTARNDGLLSVEVSGSPDQIYQGESTILTMQILIKQYKDTRYSTLSPDSREMWSLIDQQGSDWGPFLDTMRELDATHRAPRGRNHSLLNSEEERENYFLYQLQTELRPTATGNLDLSNIRINMNYPLAVRPGRSIRSLIIDNRMHIEQAIPISAQATSRGIQVKPLPTQGKPDLFNGAVGRFSISTTASPTTVAVGDPITLTMTVTDEHASPVDMDVIPAPELDRVSSLDEAFRVPREALAGVVDRRTKLFTQTIRARNEEVTSVPPIPYSFFDPASGKYETVHSRPILLDVSAADTITSSDITGAAPSAVTSDNLHDVAGGILANYTGSDRLLADQGPPDPWLLLVLLLAPPLFVAGVAATRQGVRGHLGDPARVRSRRASRNARNQLAEARSAPDTGRGALVTGAICTYVADRIGVPSAGFMRGDVITALTRIGVDPELISELDRLVADCDHLQYAGGKEMDFSTMVETASKLIDRMDTISLKQGVRS